MTRTMRGMKTFACFVLASFAMPVAATTLGGSFALTSDYVWRGSTQSAGEPAVQAGAKVAGDSGFYASAWGSNVEFAPALRANREFDFAVGWADAVSDKWALDVNLLHYRYPSTTVDLNWTEANLVATFRERWWVGVGWSHDALALGEPGTYVSAGARLPLGLRARVEATAGWYDLDATSYAHASLGIAWTIRTSFEARITAHATDDDARRFFGDDVAGTRIEAALQATF